jgi:SRSO17 transposase
VAPAQRRRRRQGSPGLRLGQGRADPARLAGPGFWLLARRRLLAGELAFYACSGPARTTLAELVRVAGIRWAVEEGFQAAKDQVALDHYQARRYDAWYRHASLAMLALAFLAAVRAQAAPAGRAGAGGG